MIPCADCGGRTIPVMLIVGSIVNGTLLLVIPPCTTAFNDPLVVPETMLN